MTGDRESRSVRALAEEGDRLRAAGRRDDALSSFRAAIARGAEILEDPENRTSKRFSSLAMLCRTTAALLTDDDDEQLQMLESAVEWSERAVAVSGDLPAVTSLAESRKLLGIWFKNHKQCSAAADQFAAVLVSYRALLEETDDVAMLANVGWAGTRLSRSLLREGRLEAAAEAIEGALGSQRRAVARAPDELDYTVGLIEALETAAEIQPVPEEKCGLLAEALDIGGPIVTAAESTASADCAVAKAAEEFTNVALANPELHRDPMSPATWAVELRRRDLARGPGEASRLRALAGAVRLLAQCAGRRGDLDAAEALFEEELALREQADRVSGSQPGIASVMCVMAQAGIQQLKHDEIQATALGFEAWEVVNRMTTGVPPGSSDAWWLGTKLVLLFLAERSVADPDLVDAARQTSILASLERACLLRKTFLGESGRIDDAAAVRDEVQLRLADWGLELP